MEQFKVELNDMESLIDTYRQVMEKSAQAAQSIKKAQAAGVAMLTAGAAKDTVYNDSGVYRFAKVIDDFAATTRVLHDYSGQALKQFVDMDKILAKQMYEAIQKDPKADPKLKRYIQEHPEAASKDMYDLAKDPEGFKQRKENEQKQREIDAQQQPQSNVQYSAQKTAPRPKYNYTYDAPKAKQPEQAKTVKQPVETVKTGQSAFIQAKEHTNHIPNEAFFNPQTDAVWGANYKDANTILKETEEFNNPEKAEWKKEAVSTGFETSKQGGVLGFMTPSEEQGIEAIDEETTVNDALNMIFTLKAEGGAQ